MEKKSGCAVVVPIYKEILSAEEKKALAHCLRVFAQRPVMLVHPQGLYLARYKEIIGERECRFLAFPSPNFISRYAYNDMLLSPWFYRAFMGYEYILVHQMDSWVFEDRLDAFTALGLDYIGCAPAREGARQEGGLSLRKTVSCMEACRAAHSLDGISLLLRRRYLTWRDLMSIIKRRMAVPIGRERPYRSEDSFFTFAAPIVLDGFRVAAPEQAARFGFHENPDWLYKKYGALPMGCHGYSQNGNSEFWKGRMECDARMAPD